MRTWGRVGCGAALQCIFEDRLVLQHRRIGLLECGRGQCASKCATAALWQLLEGFC